MGQVYIYKYFYSAVEKRGVNMEDYFEDDDIYTDEGVDSQIEDDEISLSELGFMKGYNAA